MAVVDLQNRSYDYEEPGAEFHEKYLGGVGLGAKILWDRVKAGADPLGPENMLGFTTGLLTDTGTVFTGRFTVVGKSPATGGWGDSNCGGYFSPVLKRCRIDALFLTGISDSPVYLALNDEGVEFHDAGDLWGLDALQTERELKRRHGGKAQVACIGPAGERLSALAGICNDRGRIAARGGLGSVMGAKKVKAVVAAGTRRVGVVDKERISASRKEFLKRLEKGKSLKKYMGDRLFGLVGWITRKGSVHPRQPADMWRMMLSKFGTPSLTALSAESGDSPVKNWGGVGYVDFPLSRSQKIGAQSVVRYELKKYGCYSCPIRCGGVVKIEDGPYPLEESHKPEYETLCSFGTLLLNDDLRSIFHLNDLVNRGGIDSISCGAVVAFAIECFENGVLSKDDMDGLEPTWGNSAAIIALTEKIIRREGVGDLLADGVKRAAEKIGDAAKPFAVHCGGVEPAMHDPKFDPGFGASYVCEPTPGRHTISSLQYLELQRLEKQFSRARKIGAFSTRKQKHRYDDKGEALAVDSCYKMLIDCAGACFFGTQVGGPLPLCDWMNAATGWDLSADEYLTIGERVEQLRHAFNVREGLNPLRDFRPHPRIYGDPPQEKGPAKNVTLDIDALGRDFYQALDWDPETGIPSLERLEVLGLHEVISAFYSENV